MFCLRDAKKGELASFLLGRLFPLTTSLPRLCYHAGAYPRRLAADVLSLKGCPYHSHRICVGRSPSIMHELADELSSSSAAVGSRPSPRASTVRQTTNGRVWAAHFLSPSDLPGQDCHLTEDGQVSARRVRRGRAD